MPVTAPPTFLLLLPVTLCSGVIYHGPDTRFTDQEICLVFTGDDIQIVDVSNKCVMLVRAITTYSSRSYVHQGWWSEDHSYFVMGDENDELNYGVKTRSLLWDATDLTRLTLAHDFRATTTAIGR